MSEQKVEEWGREETATNTDFPTGFGERPPSKNKSFQILPSTNLELL